MVTSDGEGYHPVDYDFVAPARPIAPAAEAKRNARADEAAARAATTGDTANRNFLAMVWSAP